MAKMKQEYVLKATYDGKNEVGQFRSDLKSLGKIAAIKKLGSDIRDLNTRFESAKKKLQEQAREMKGTEKVTKEMSRAYSKSQKEVSKLAAALQNKKQAFSKSTEALRKAGVDTKNLAAAERQLTQSSKATGEVWAARQALGVKSHRDIRNEVAKLNLAYKNLKSSGKATALELFEAKEQLRRKTKELSTANRTWASSFADAQMGILALAGSGYGIAKLFKEFSGFESGMAEVNTLLDISKDKFSAFKEETRNIIGDLPQQSNDLTKALYDIISAGVNLEDSTVVLEKSAKAATAGITETKTAVNVGIGAMNAYGQGVDKLDGIFDTLFQTVKSGVTTFPELAQNIGDVLPTARAAEVELKDIGAAMATLTKAGIKTPQAATALKGAIRAMAAPTPEARKKFEELGISWEGLIPTLEKIREKSLSIDQMRALIPDAEASTGVLSLTQNMGELKSILTSMDNAGGSMEEAYKKMADTPDHEIKQMLKSVKNLGISLGELSSVIILPLASALGQLTSSINDSNIVVKAFLGILGGAATATLLWNLGLSQALSGVKGLALWVGESKAVMFLFSAAVAKARGAMLLLNSAILANPITASVLATLALAASAWAIFGESSLEASKKHGQAAKQLGKTRKEIDEEIASLEKLQKTLEQAEPGSKQHIDAQKELARILPDANLALDEQGNVIAKVGEAAAENTNKLKQYIDALKEESRLTLALQLEQQVKAYQEANTALDEYKENLTKWYGIGGEGNLTAPLWREINKLSGTYDKNIEKGDELRANLKQQEKAYDDLIASMSAAGMSAGEVGRMLDQAHIDKDLKVSIVADYKKYTASMAKIEKAAKDSFSKQAQISKEKLNEMEKQYQEYVKEVKRLQDEIDDLTLEVKSDKLDFAAEEARIQIELVGEERGREIILSQVAEIKRLAAEAGKAGGDGWKQQVDLLNRAKNLIMSMSTEAKSVTKEEIALARKKMELAKREVEQHNVSSKRSAYRQALEDYQQLVNARKQGPSEEEKQEKIREKYERIKEINQQILEIKKQQIEKLGKEQDGVASSMDDLIKEADFQDLSKSMDDSKKQWIDNWKKMRASSMEDLESIDRKLDHVMRDRTSKMYYSVSEKKESGGLVGLKMMLGGLVQKMATGGGVGYRNAMNGLHLPGYGGGDRRWILGEDGEVMIKKESVKLAGVRAALAFNAGRWDVVVSELLNRFNLDVNNVVRRRFGGLINSVHSITAPSQKMAAGGMVAGTGSIPVLGHYTHDFHFPGSDRPVRMYSDRENLRRMIEEMERIQRRSS